MVATTTVPPKRRRIHVTSRIRTNELVRKSRRSHWTVCVCASVYIKLSYPRDKHISLVPRNIIEKKNHNYFLLIRVLFDLFDFIAQFDQISLVKCETNVNRHTLVFRLAQQHLIHFCGDCRCLFVWSFCFFFFSFNGQFCVQQFGSTIIFFVRDTRIQ